MLLKTLLASAITLSLAACQPSAEPPASPPPVARLEVKPQIPSVVSLQEVMQAFVDSSADGIWESVSTTVTKKGVEEKQPRTDAEWQEVRNHALRLIEGAALLQTEGRPIVHAGKKLEDHHVEGINTPEDISAAIAKDRPAFIGRAQALQQAGLETLAAIDSRDINKLLVAGQNLDAACEHCHTAYWYPNTKTPWPAPLVAKK